MNEEIDEGWPSNCEMKDGELFVRGSGNGYDEVIKVPADKMDAFRAELASGAEFKKAIRQFTEVVFVWWDSDSSFYD